MLFFGCEIQETKVDQGQIFVELHDDQGTEVLGARIYLDGTAQSVVTPGTISGLVAGTYLVETSKPGYFQSSEEITLGENEARTVSLLTSAAPAAAIELTNAPENTQIIVNNEAVGSVPPSVFGLSVGTWDVSAYLEGHATDAPARWTVTLAEGDTARITSGFTPLSAGSTVGELAPVFTLPSDLDSSIFRLQDYRGKIVLVSFFFYTCNPCLAEFPHIQTVYADPQYAGQLAFFGVDASDPWSLFSIYKSTHPTLGLQFPLLWAQQTTAYEDYDVASCPTNFLIDPTGTIRYRWQSISEAELRSAVETLIAEFDIAN
ncbi:MAG: redoxin domain-containing protein [Calditrichaeota bacterium]|nr:redoxin domain-containing protein [Calditrichota bacterium]